MKTFAQQLQELQDKIVLKLADLNAIFGNNDNDYNMRLISLKDVNGLPPIELLADGYPVTHISDELVIANEQHYGLSVLTTTDQLDPLCDIVDSLVSIARRQKQ